MEIRDIFKILFLLIAVLFSVIISRFGVPLIILAPAGFLMGTGASYWANELADWLEVKST